MICASLVVTVLAAACATPAEVPVERLPGVHQRVFVIVLENKDWSRIKHSASAPYLHSLLARGAYTENYQQLPGVRPSEPNYIWMEAGDTLGVRSNDDPAVNHVDTPDHLTRQLDVAGISWRSYQEDISGHACPLTAEGLYAPKHNPFVFFDDVTGNRDPNDTYCIEHNRPFTELADDLRDDTTARYNFITPNLCHDMHGAEGCPRDLIRAGDDWLAEVVPRILASKAYRDDGLLLITFDESAPPRDAAIMMIALSNHTKPGHASQVYYTHSSYLRTLQNIFGVRPYLRGAATANSLRDLFDASYP
jgi:hypothetical protein